VIFATAFDQYALKAFDANAIGYLLKPVAREKLAQAIERAGKLLANPNAAAAESKRLRVLAEAEPGQLSGVIARHRDRRVLLALEDVCFLRMEDELVKAKTAKQLYWTDYTLSVLEDRLPNPPFLRVHRNAIANLRQIAEIAPSRGGFVLTMKDADRTEIQVSERQSKAVRSLLRS
jgi:DNA-binding LytR/AlgR family response regulator